MTRLTAFYLIYTTLWACLSPLTAQGASTLSAEALFRRCYGQLTQLSPPTNHPQLVAVRGGKNPITACMEVLDLAKFTAAQDTKIANGSSFEAKAVLATFHRMHSSFFKNRSFLGNGQGGALVGTRDMYEEESPAFYFDRALFRPATGLNSVLLLNSTLRGIRTDDDPTNGVASGKTKAEHIFQSSNYKMSGIGELLGVEPIAKRNTPYLVPKFLSQPNGTKYSGNVDFGAHYGGGVLGSVPYILLNVDEPVEFSANGGIRMPRKWARAIFSDLLCRNLPVVNAMDAAAFVVPTSSVPFRKDRSCVQCHASMDRVASTLRNFNYTSLGLNGVPYFGVQMAKLYPPSHGALTEWPSEPYPTFVRSTNSGEIDPLPAKPAPPARPNYNQTNPTGVFYFRDYTGALINENVSNIADLAETISDLPDFYLCTAKRYYSYFMGVDVDLDPLHTGDLNATDRKHRDAVVQLGLDLKDRTGDKQSLKRLIQKILSLPDYRRSDFGAERGD